ncbi:MAG: DUF3363 domain-containing protein [Novosphingobium sp.]|nr:DUF3363 domain-containing protein [Novosphingobium sp.]
MCGALFARSVPCFTRLFWTKLRCAEKCRDVPASRNCRFSAAQAHIAGKIVTRDDSDIRIRPGRIRSRGDERSRPAIAQALTSARRAGGIVSASGQVRSPRNSTFGRGRAASLRAGHRLGSRARMAVIKARVVRHARSLSLAAHLKYLQRDGVTRDDAPGKLFGPDGAEVDRDAFAEHCQQDRHHFRFIVSPDDALEMTDLREFTGALMVQVEKDLGTKLDWAAIDHWNTEHPHVHVIVRGVGDDGQNLVISRDYIREGMRGRAGELITRELGPKTELDVRRSLERQVEAERWTQIDRDLVRHQQRHGMIDTAPDPEARPDSDHALKLGRLRKLERLTLAEQVKPGLWVIADNAEPALHELGMRGDIIKRMHRAMQERGIERGVSSYYLAGETAQPIIGRLVERGLHDELTGAAYAIVDGIDGRTHHLTLPGLEETGDCRPGAIVELRQFDDRRGRARVALAVRSDLDIAAQIEAPGATWLDRRNLDQQKIDLGGGFGAEVADAMQARAEHLVGQGLARHDAQRFAFARNLLDTLNRRELDAIGEKMVREFGLPYTPAKSGEFVAGSVRRQVQLASGRFAMIDNGLGFALVPWTPALDNRLGKYVSGVMRGDGGVDWSMGRGRGIGL